MTHDTPPAEESPTVAVEAARLSFAQLYEAYFGFVWRTVRRLGAPEASVDDLVQEVFVVIYRRYAEFDERGATKSWIFAIVRNVVRAHRRTLGRKNPHVLSAEARADVDDLQDATMEHDAARREAGRLVSALLEELDDDKREVFVLAELEQMTAPEIALAVGIPTNTVSSRLRAARQDFAAAAARHRARDEWRLR